MKRKIFSVFFALVLVLSFSLVTAVPVAAEDTLQVIPFELATSAYGGEHSATCAWSDVEANDGSLSVNLDSGSTGTGAEAKIIIDASDVGVETLGDIATISWYVSTKAGYSPHIDITLDIADESADMLTAELACNNANYTHPPVPGDDEWRQTFEMTGEDGYDAIDSGTILWVSGMGAGTTDAPFGTLSEWQEGTVANDPDTEFPEEVVINSDTPVLKFEIEVDNWIVESEAYVDDIAINGVVYYGLIQDAIDSAIADETINVAAGIYDEQVEIDMGLTLQGAGDTTVIQPSGAGILTTVKTTPWLGTGTYQMAAIVFVDTAGETVTVKDLKIDGSLITGVPVGATWVVGLAYLETSGTIDNVAVKGYPQLGTRSCGIWTSAISSVSTVEVKYCNAIGYNRGSIYACGATLTVDFNHNEVYGPGEIVNQVPNGMFFLRGATGSATYNKITDLAYTGEIYRSTGIGTYRSGSGLLFGHNEIYNVQNAFAIAGASQATIEYNDIHNCHTGVKLEAIGDNRASDTNIQYNDIYDNDFAIRCGTDMGDGNEAHYNNFVGNLGAEWLWGDDTWIGAVCNLHETYILDATNNWWGDISGSEQATTNPGGTGNKVSDNVEYVPWLTRDFQTALDDNIAYFGIPMVQLNTGWNTFSTPIALDPACDTWGDYKALGDGLNVVEPPVISAYRYDAGASPPHFVPLASDYELEPCDAIYVRMAEPDIAAILFSPDYSVPTKEVYPGWNLIGLAWLPTEPDEGMPVEDALTSLYMTPGDYTGYSQVVSPPFNQPSWTFVRDGDSKLMYPTWGYWVFMENGPDTLAGSTFTPMSLYVPPSPPPEAEAGLMEVPFQWYEVTVVSADYFEQWDDDSFDYALPWTFPFAGKDIFEIEVTSNGLIDLLESGETSEVTSSYDYMISLAGDYPESDIIFAWNDDLDSGTYGFYGVEYDSDNDVVVVHWETETNDDESATEAPELNYFQLWLFPDGSIKWNFKEFNYVYYGYDLETGIYDSTSGTLFNVAYAMGEPDAIFNTPEKSYMLAGEYLPQVLR